MYVNISYKLAPTKRSYKENLNDTSAEVVKYKLPVIFFWFFIVYDKLKQRAT